MSLRPSYFVDVDFELTENQTSETVAQIKLDVGKSLNDLYAEIVIKSEKAAKSFTMSKNSMNELSRDNLLSYLAMREKDLSELQISLSNLGLSSLGRLEGDVLLSVEQVLEHLGYPRLETTLHKPTFELANSILEERSRRLLGRPREGRKTRIMVTLDAPYIYQPELLEQLLVNGMDIARINCAHDSEREWLMLITAIRVCRRAIDTERKKGRKDLQDFDGPCGSEDSHGRALAGIASAKAISAEGFRGKND